MNDILSSPCSEKSMLYAVCKAVCWCISSSLYQQNKTSGTRNWTSPEWKRNNQKRRGKEKKLYKENEKWLKNLLTFSWISTENRKQVAINYSGKTNLWSRSVMEHLQTLWFSKFSTLYLQPQLSAQERIASPREHLYRRQYIFVIAKNVLIITFKNCLWQWYGYTFIRKLLARNY